MTTPHVGMTVQDKTLGQRFLGTITDVSADKRWVHVQWHGTCVTEVWPVESVNILS